jgi:hypothetical protein
MGSVTIVEQDGRRHTFERDTDPANDHCVTFSETTLRAKTPLPPDARVQVIGSGGADIGRFEVEVGFPQPRMPAPITEVSFGTPLDVTWAPSSDGAQTSVIVSDQALDAYCDSAPGASSLTIPAALTAQLKSVRNISLYAGREFRAMPEDRGLVRVTTQEEWGIYPP